MLQTTTTGGLQAPEDSRHLLHETLRQVTDASLALNVLFDGDEGALANEEAVTAKTRLREAVECFQKHSGFSSARLGVELGVSDQTVLRWKKVDCEDPYFKTRPTDQVLGRWRELTERLTSNRTVSLKNDLGLWTWQDLVLGMDDNPRMRRAWIVSGSTFGECVAPAECRKLLDRVQARPVTYIYVFPGALGEKKSQGHSSYEVIQDSCRAHKGRVRGSVLGIALPPDPHPYSISTLYHRTQAVFYEHHEEHHAFLALPSETSIARSDSVGLELLWKKLPQGEAGVWISEFFAPLWRHVERTLAAAEVSSQRPSEGLDLNEGGTLYVALRGNGAESSSE